MAKAKKQEKAFNYNAAVRELREQGPQRLYLLWGREDYLREAYLTQLKQFCPVSYTHLTLPTNREV